MVSLEANISKYERTLAKAMAQTNTQASGIERRFATMNKKVADSFDFSGAATRALGTLGLGVSAAASISAVTAAAKQFTDLQNSLKVTGLEGAKLDKTLSDLFQVAQKSGTEISPLTKLYGQLSQSQKELNASSGELMKFTDGVAIALRVAGTSSTQAAGALLQLSQAMGSGVVRAEEFNSVNEGARPILQAVAAGMKEAGGSVATLKNLVNDGKISSEAFFRAFLAGMPQLEAQVSKADATIDQAKARIGNAFIILVGHIDKVSGASKNAGANLNAFAGVVQNLPGYFDAALKKLGELEKYLASIGNNPVWAAIGKFMNMPLPTKGPNGEIPDINVLQDRERLQSVTKELVGEEARLAELRSKRSSDTDDIMIRQVAGRVNYLKQERDLLQQRNKLAEAGPNFVGPGGRVAEGARDPTGQAPAPQPVKPISYKDFAVKPKDKDGADTDAFQRAIQQTEKRTAALSAETAAIDLGAAAQARARVQSDLETAAKKKNADEGLKNTEVTKAQREEITRVADAYLKAAEAAEKANSPLASFARQARDTDRNMQDFAVQGLQSFESAFAGFVTGAESAESAFKKMADAIIADLARIAIRQAITGPIAGALGSVLGGGGGGLGAIFGGARASGGPVSKGKAYIVGEKRPEVFVPGQSGTILPRVPSSSGGGQTNVNVSVVNNSAAQIQTQEVVDGRGNRSIQFMIDDAVASSMSRPGSATRGALRNNFGAQPVGVRR